MELFKYCPHCGWANKHKLGLTHCEKCGNRIPLSVRPESWKGERAEWARHAANSNAPPDPQPAEPTPLAAVLRFPWGQEIAVADRLRIGRFDSEKPSLISDWDPTSQELAKKLQNPHNGGKPVYAAVSRKHAEIYLQDGKFFIVDSGSKFGTRLTGGGLPEVALAPGTPYELTAGRKIDLDQERPALTILVVEIRGAPGAPPSSLTTRM